ncbi:MAG TPA: KH domain-containing protein [Patescibacteria group bacterium]|nr:KH domain-containing protein [Patescibacteria group bacterium]
MKDFIEYLIKQIVTHPDDVKIEEKRSEEDSQIGYYITVSPEDMGIVIGKEGRTIKSLRALARAKAIKDGIRINLELVESGDANL